jgi:hypothetical protein
MPLNMQEVFVQEVWRVGSDSVYWVRREASFAIGALAKVVPLEMVSNYLVSNLHLANIDVNPDLDSYPCINHLSRMNSGMCGILSCLRCREYLRE